MKIYNTSRRCGHVWGGVTLWVPALLFGTCTSGVRGNGTPRIKSCFNPQRESMDPSGACYRHNKSTRPRAPSDPCYFVVPASSRCHPPSNVTATPAPRSRSTRLCSRTTRRLRPRCRTVQVVFARTGYPISFLTRFSFAPIGSSVSFRTLPSWPITRFCGSTIASRGSLPLPPDRSRMILW